MTTSSKRWRVVGVDRESGLETALIVDASSASVAKIMVEQRGVIVADVVDVEADEIESVRRDVERSWAGSDASEPASKPRLPKRGEIICANPNCGYVGPPKRVARASAIIAVLLLLFFLLPGILYCLFRSGYRYYCPRCGFQLRSDV
jgi:hypothetical protein